MILGLAGAVSMASIRVFAIGLVFISLLAAVELQAADSADCAGAVVDENSVPVAAAQVKFENNTGKVYRKETNGAARLILQNILAWTYTTQLPKTRPFLLTRQRTPLPPSPHPT